MIKKLRITVEGKAYDVTVEVLGDGQVSASAAQPAAPAQPAPAVVAAPPPPPPPAPAAPKRAAPAGSGDVPSPLAGKVVSLDVRVGATVKEGDTVITLEAMKMNTYVTAPAAGEVQAILVNVGDSVEEGQPLIRIG